MSNKIRKLKSLRKKGYCPCCGYKTFNAEEYNTYQVCPICFWEDESLTETVIEKGGGANNVSLVQAQKNFKNIRAMEKQTKKLTRDPKKDEVQHQDWPWLIK